MQTIGDLIDKLIDTSVEHFNATSYSKDSLRKKFLQVEGVRKYYYRVLKPSEKKQKKKVSFPPLTKDEYKILEIIGDQHNVNPVDLFSEARKREIVDARMQGMVIFYVYLCYTYKRTGNVFRRDHSTVIHAVETTNDLFDSDPVFTRLFVKTLAKVAKELPHLFYSEEMITGEFRHVFASRKKVTSFNTRLGYKSLLSEVEMQKEHVEKSIEENEEAY